MVSSTLQPNVNGGSNAGGTPAARAQANGQEPGRLPDALREVFELAFQDVHCPLHLLQPSNVFEKTPYYRAEATLGQIILLCVPQAVLEGEDRLPLLELIFPFRTEKTIGLFILSETVEALSEYHHTLQQSLEQAYSRLRMRILYRPHIQELNACATFDQQKAKLKEWLELERLASLTDTLSDEDRGRVKNCLAELATSPGPTVEPKVFFKDLVLELSLPKDLTQQIIGIWTGNTLVDAELMIQALVYRNYPQNAAMPGYTMLGSLLEKLAYKGCGKEMVQIIDQYGLITNPATLQKLRQAYP
jgi:hypothetical protein